MGDENPVSRPGYKTTEFWLSAVASVAGLLMASGVFTSGGTWDKVVGLVVSGLAAMGYAASRGNVKANM